MRQKYRFLFISLFAIVALFATSCSKTKEINLVSYHIDHIKMKSTQSGTLYVALEIKNPTHFTLQINKGSGLAYVNDREFATFNIPSGPYKVEPNGTFKIVVPVDIEITNIFAVLGLDLDLHELDLSPFSLAGSVQVQLGPIKKTFKTEKCPIEELSSKFDF